MAFFISFLNRLLEGERWARERLAPFAGAVVELRAGPVTVRAAIAEGGLAEAAPPGAQPAAVVLLGPDGLRVAGEGAAAEAVRGVARELRWDVEEELSRLVGDIAAHRLAQAGRDFVAWQRDAARRLAASAADALAREDGMLVARAELERLAGALDSLDARLRELERRVARLG